MKPIIDNMPTKSIIAADYDNTYDRFTATERSGVDFIITGRNFDRYEDIVDESNPNIPIFFNPGKEELMDIVMHKAEILNKTKADTFYEDQKIQVNLLRALCPKCNIILYGSN